MQPMLRIAVNAARAAGDIISRAYSDVDLLKIENKSSNDFVTEVDRAAEKAVISTVRTSYPEHRFIGEEYGVQGSKDSDVEWIIDPLDGTTNFTRGIPHFAVSVAVRVKGKLEHAVIYDPIKQDEFTASRGRGAQLNGRKIRVSNRKSLTGSLLTTGVPFTAQTLQHLDAYHACSKALLERDSAGIRRPGAASLDLAYLAAGKYDGFWEMNLKIWDIAAGVLLIREAGGLITDLSGGESYLKTGNLVCGAPKVFREMLPIVKENMGHI